MVRPARMAGASKAMIEAAMAAATAAETEEHGEPATANGRLVERCLAVTNNSSREIRRKVGRTSTREEAAAPAA